MNGSVAAAMHNVDMTYILAAPSRLQHSHIATRIMTEVYNTIESKNEILRREVLERSVQEIAELFIQVSYYYPSYNLCPWPDLIFL